MSKYKGFRVESARLKSWDYRNDGFYYVTIVTKYRRNYFGKVIGGKMFYNILGKIALEELLNIEKHRINVKLDIFQIMPNHIHVIIIIQNAKIDLMPQNKSCLTADSLGAIIGQFKSQVTKKIHLAGNNKFGWHPRFFDHIIRNEKALYSIRKYIQLNPLKWELDEYNNDKTDSASSDGLYSL